MTKEELISIINLLSSGKWNFSLQETQQVIVPLINKLSQEVDKLDAIQKDKQK